MNFSKKLSISIRVVVVLCLVFAVVGFLLRGLMGGGGDGSGVEQEMAATKYVCPMNVSYHPYFSSMEPDEKCGYCGMDLIAESDVGSDEGERILVMSEAAIKLAEIETRLVERRFVDMEIPLVGKIDFDETRIKTISSWVDGRLERLFVDYTGITVNKGDHLVEIYSPTFYSAQEEMLQALKTADKVPAGADAHVKKMAQRTVEAVREKLKLLGLNEDQIVQLEKERKTSARVEIRAPIGGIVIHKAVKEGMYVKTGTHIYTVADMTKLWVKLDAYESDLPWLKYGQDVVMRTEAFGDQPFHGWISFIDPVLDPHTRTVKVRVVVDNPDGLLRPNMFVRAVVKAKIGDGGVVLAEDLKDKWICPMHPEVVKDGKDDCDICGMDLVPAVDLGYAKQGEVTAPLVVPGSAVMITGKRAIVYVRKENKDRPAFEGVEIELGPRAGDYYLVRSGLEEGQKVVANGSFKIDSALQLRAKPSMMSPDGGVAVPVHHGAHEGVAEKPAPKGKPQELCPIMGGKINKKVYKDYKGHRVYFCCPGCDKPFMEDPDGHIGKMLKNGIKLDKTPEVQEAGHEGHGE